MAVKMGRRGYGCISIHALRGEGDRTFNAHATVTITFQSTPSVWRATAKNVLPRLDRYISIHALRVEDDGARAPQSDDSKAISIHALRGEGDDIAGI